MSNKDSEGTRDDCIDERLSVATFDISKFNPDSSTFRLTETMAVSLEERRTAATHHDSSDVKLSRASQTSPERPRKLNKCASQNQSRADRGRPVAKERPSHTERVFKEDPEGPVGIPFCLLKTFVDNLVPVTGVDEQEGLNSEHDHSLCDNVKKPPRVRQQFYGECELSNSSEARQGSSTKTAPKTATSQYLSHPTFSLLRSSDKIEGLAKFVHNYYSSITDEPLTQPMSLEVEALEEIKPKAPVTKENLKELDLPSIQNTISLRFDLCFDQGLFFQRVSGVKGNEKRIKARIFYRYVSLELQSINHDLNGSCEICQNSDSPRPVMQSRLACYFWSLRELLILLVPDSEKITIEQSIDPKWLTRMIRAGHFDAEKFSMWLHKLLTRHCAPMRDNMAKEMSEKLSSGASNRDMDLLANGMEVLLSLLENMKIDIANHQIRTFKFLLIADTVPFLRDCFTKMSETGQIQLKDSKEWFDEIRLCSPDRSEFESFMQGFIRLLCTVEDELALPLTFRYGEDRIHGLRNELLDYAHLEICMEFYRTRLDGILTPHTDQQEIKQRVLQLMCNEGTSEGVRQHFQAIELEILRAASNRIEKVESSNPPLDDNDDDESDDFSILSHTMDLAYDDCAPYEEELECFLNKREETELDLLSSKLYEPTLAIAKKFLKMETLQISNYQRARQDQRANIGSPGPLIPDIVDITSKIAHMGVVHWQIWAEMAYLNDS